MAEEWKPVVGYEGLYEVSNYGRVKSLHWYGGNTEKIMSLSKRPDGYLKTVLSKNGKVKNYLVHRLVAEAFLKNVDGCDFVNHKDENRANNRTENLEWCTKSYNQLYSLKLHPERKYVFGNNFKDKETGENLSPRTKHLPVKHFDPVEQRTKNDELIAVFGNPTDAYIATGIKACNILRVCRLNQDKNRRRKNHICRSGGYIWRFYNDEQKVLK